MEQALDVVAIGHAIVDVLASTPDDFPAAHGRDKGTMTLIDAAEAEALYDALGPATEVSGGSAANTAAGIAALGGRCAFVGKVANDLLGKVFTHDIRASGVEFHVEPAPGGPGTGRCLIMVTPDAERTMSTFLGAGAGVAAEDVDPETLARAQVVYAEGYLCGLDAEERLLRKAAAATHASGGRFAMSLSDPFWVELHGPELDALIDDVDIVFGNEQETLGLTGAADLASAIARLAGRCELVVVTRGPAGSVVARGDERVEVAAQRAREVIDTTGAGDLYAAGFLYGLTHGLDLAACARLGGVAAAEIISHVGARPQASLVELATKAGLLR